MQYYVTNREKLVTEINKFAAYVKYQNKENVGNKSDLISFRDTNGFLGYEEGYKSGAPISAREVLNCKEWKEDWVGSGKIKEKASKAINKAGNLVYKYQITNFKDKLQKDTAAAEQVLYDIYRGDDAETAFSEAVKLFGGKYDLIAFLFFVKDDSRFLPISPVHFDKGFKNLEINYSMSGKCSWENYQGFISVISEIQDELSNVLAGQVTADVRLIDAHSFVWIIQQGEYINWQPDPETQVMVEQKSEDDMHKLIEGAGGKRERNQSVYARNREVAVAARQRAKGICDLCGNPAPFKDKNGNGYLEVHHIEWLSRGGKDSTKNTVALCPNCHRKMHVVDDPVDVQYLKDVVTKKYGTN